MDWKQRLKETSSKRKVDEFDEFDGQHKVIECAFGLKGLEFLCWLPTQTQGPGITGGQTSYRLRLEGILLKQAAQQLRLIGVLIYAFRTFSGLLRRELSVLADHYYKILEMGPYLWSDYLGTLEANGMSLNHYTAIKKVDGAKVRNFPCCSSSNEYSQTLKGQKQLNN